MTNLEAENRGASHDDLLKTWIKSLPIVPNAEFASCPIEASLGVLGKKWSMQIIRDMAMRFVLVAFRMSISPAYRKYPCGNPIHLIIARDEKTRFNCNDNGIRAVMT